MKWQWRKWHKTKRHATNQIVGKQKPQLQTRENQRKLKLYESKFRDTLAIVLTYNPRIADDNFVLKKAIPNLAISDNFFLMNNPDKSSKLQMLSTFSFPFETKLKILSPRQAKFLLVHIFGS